MTIKHNSYAKIMLKKASKSICQYKIAALGIDHKGKMIGCMFNRPRFTRKGGGIHAEMALMARYGKNLKTIFILRVGNSGNIRPIDPCIICSKKALELGIKIETLEI